MKRMQRLVSLLLSLVLAASLLAACGGNSGNNSSASGGSGGAADDAGSASQSGEPIEITVGFWNVEAGLSGGDSDKMLKTLEEKVGVPIKIVSTGPKRDEIALRNV